MAVPYRRHLLDGKFICVNGFNAGASARNVHIFVFNDVILVTDEGDTEYDVEQYSYYDRVSLNPTPAADVPDGWQLELKGQKYLLLAENAEVKKQFCDMITNTAAEVRTRQKELEEAKEARRTLMRSVQRSNHSQPSHDLGILGISDDISSIADADDDAAGAKQDELLEEESARRAQEKLSRAKSKDRIKAEVMSIITSTIANTMSFMYLL